MATLNNLCPQSPRPIDNVNHLQGRGKMVHSSAIILRRSIPRNSRGKNNVSARAYSVIPDAIFSFNLPNLLDIP